MMDSLKDAGKNISRGLSRTLDQIAEGWRDLVHHSSNALTHFVRRKEDEGNKEQGTTALPVFRSWSLLAGDMEETDKEIVVRIEVPGMEKKDCQITLDGRMLYLKGEKCFERSSSHSTYHVMERAYGIFERAIPLPCEGGCGQGTSGVYEWCFDCSVAQTRWHARTVYFYIIK
ncbi:Hsp20/alpha crystallin family protein [Nitrosospira multiformis]|uniref:HSP20 family protein n=1 Tax=Nitrosospira multiformis TaxID=1231 RepID=A0A1I7IZV7_9PROT|nr:Hsp20/alpha crystallin family protein [Nitrosospira multiformis]SFU78458.1 HSP20 family protein [Nitrosospira multiformis]